jgi:hypothetical protein
MIQKAPYSSTLQCTARAPGVSSTISKNLRRIRSGGQLQAFKHFILEFCDLQVNPKKEHKSET